MIRLQPGSTLFPYTTLFRSRLWMKIFSPFLPGGKNPRRAVPKVCGAVDILDIALLVVPPREILFLSLRSEEHTSELQSRPHLVCRLLLEKKKQNTHNISLNL